MKPVLYQYRNNESVIKPMEGYTPGEGWTPLYDQAAIDAAVAAERERCAMVAWTHYTGACKKAGISPSTFTQFSCADAIRKGE